jgi:hypothetical protein
VTPTRCKRLVDPLGRPRLIVLCGARSCPEFFGDWEPDRAALRLAQTYEFAGVADGADIYAPKRRALPRTNRLRDRFAALKPLYVQSDKQRPPVVRCGRCGRLSYLSVPETVSVEAAVM